MVCQDWIQMCHMHNKCPTHCTIAPSLSTLFFSIFWFWVTTVQSLGTTPSSTFILRRSYSSGHWTQELSHVKYVLQSFALSSWTIIMLLWRQFSIAEDQNNVHALENQKVHVTSFYCDTYCDKMVLSLKWINTEVKSCQQAFQLISYSSPKHEELTTCHTELSLG